jgi:hypothetical protein
MKYLILLALLMSGCVTHTATLICKKEIAVKECVRDQLGDVKIKRILKVDKDVYLVDYR